jgi:hypothetical protein
LSVPAWAGLLALVNQGRQEAGEPALNASSPTGTQQALYALPQTDYNLIHGGFNGYNGGPGYNLVTGLGTPRADRLVPDLITDQGADTADPGPTVGPLQDSSLVSTGAGLGGRFNVFSVFDSFTVSSRVFDPGQGSGPGPGLDPLGMAAALATGGAVRVAAPLTLAGAPASATPAAAGYFSPLIPLAAWDDAIRAAIAEGDDLAGLLASLAEAPAAMRAGHSLPGGSWTRTRRSMSSS